MRRHMNTWLLVITMAVLIGVAIAHLPRSPISTELAPIHRDQDGALVVMQDRARINLNRADAALLMTLPGIGPVLAQRIIEHRAQHGPFLSVDQLTQINGISQTKLDAIRSQLIVLPVASE